VSNSVSCLALAVGLVVLGADADATCANAEPRLDAAYAATLLGLPIGEISWQIDLGDNQFLMEATGKTSALLQILARGYGSVVAQGTFAAGKPAASKFALKLDAGRWSDDLEILWIKGKAKEIVRTPMPAPSNPNLVLLTDADRIGVVDPMTALLVFVPGRGEIVVPEACERTVPVFDGHARYNFRLGFKRIDKVKAEKGYEGPVIVCSVAFTPLAGYDPNRFLVTYLAAQHDMEIWLAPLAGTRLLAPYRISLPTPMGLGVLEATKFESLGPRFAPH
jgi:hypothetical protein